MKQQTFIQVSTPYGTPKSKGLPLRDQPGYRVATNTEACTLTELLAALIGGAQQIELAEVLVARYGDVHGLARASVQDLANIKGFGNQTAVRIKAALGLGKELLKPSDERVAIHSPTDAAALVQVEMSTLMQEQLRVILLDTRNRVIEVVMVYQGSLNSSQVRVGELFKHAISRCAAAMIVAHNHPSGDPTPSPDDVAVTRAIVQAGKLLDVDVLDHLVIGTARFVSLKERGLGFDGGSGFVKDNEMRHYFSERRAAYQAGTKPQKGKATSKRKRPPQETCTCEGYAFPHRKGSGECLAETLCAHDLPVYGNPSFEGRCPDCDREEEGDYRFETWRESRVREVPSVYIANADLYQFTPDDVGDGEGSVCWWLAALDTSQDTRCPDCEGAGRLADNHSHPCPTCGGKGEIQPREG